jgi:hypothetical protein
MYTRQNDEMLDTSTLIKKAIDIHSQNDSFLKTTFFTTLTNLLWEII